MQHGIQSFFPADSFIFLGVFAGDDKITVQVASPDRVDRSFAWRDADGQLHTESPDSTLASLVSWAAAAEASEDSGKEADAKELSADSPGG